MALSETIREGRKREYGTDGMKRKKTEKRRLDTALSVDSVYFSLVRILSVLPMEPFLIQCHCRCCGRSNLFPDARLRMVPGHEFFEKSFVIEIGGIVMRAHFFEQRNRDAPGKP